MFFFVDKRQNHLRMAAYFFNLAEERDKPQYLGLGDGRSSASVS